MALVELQMGKALLTGGAVLGLTSPVGQSEELVVSMNDGRIQVYNVCVCVFV